MAVLGADDTPAWAKGEGPPPPGPMPQQLMEDNIMKLLFMPKHKTHMLIKEHEWDQLDMTLLQDPKFLSMKDLRIACENRGLSPEGNRVKLSSDLTGSVMEQRGEEERQRILEMERRRARMRALGGCFMIGKGTRGCLGTGDRAHSSVPLYVTSLANDRVMRVFTGSDSGVVFALTRTEEIFVWGAVTGPLGLPQGQKPVPVFVKPEDKYTFDRVDSDEESDAEDPDDLLAPVKMERLSKEHVVDLAVGRTHCAALTFHGDIFGWGYHQHNQLGFLLETVGAGLTEKDGERALEAYTNRRTMVKYVPTMVRPDTEAPCANIAAGTDSTLVADREGRLMVWGDQNRRVRPDQVAYMLQGKHVRQVSCGAMHCAVLLDDSRVLTWGVGDGGRLGHGDAERRNMPTIVQRLAGEAVAKVVCSVWHTAAIVVVPPYTKGGLLYTWGTGMHGQLGHGTTKTVLEPTAVMDLYDMSVAVVDVSLGMYHNALITADGECMTWGSNKYGCLGRPTEMEVVPASYTPVPGLVEKLHEVGKLGPVCSVACGRFYTAVCLEPYTGPSAAAMSLKHRQKEEKKAAIERARAARDELSAKAEAKRLRAERIEMVAFLNGGFPGCKACQTPWDCAGFVADVLRPTACIICGHERDMHTLERGLDDDELSHEMLRDFVETVNFQSKRARPPTP